MEPLPALEGLGVDALAALVAKHDQLYWEQHAPEISDYDYDRLVNALRAAAPDHPLLSSMGAEAPAKGVRHVEPMLSLDKCYSDDELARWAAGFEGDAVMMPKFDGIACALRYGADGALVLAATRGDGIAGDDITANVREIADVPHRLASATAVEVRGEVFMRLSVFARYKAEGMANPRNLAAGAVKQKDPKKSGAYGLSFAAYDLVGADADTHAAELEWLAQQGFPRIDYEVVPRDGLRAAYERMAQRRASLDYEIDGVVFKTDRLDEQRRLGATAHHPRFAIAYKFQGDSGTSTLRSVEWGVARSGAITPVAVVDPVQLSGVTVTRASLHNAGFIEKLGLSLGAEVVMMRRGGVIPNVEFVAKAGTEPVSIPRTCPSCGAPTEQREDFLFCSAPRACRGVQLGVLAHWASATDMLGFGEAILQQAWDAGLLRTPRDFYTLRAADLATLERCGDKAARKLVQEVDRKRTVDLATFLRALGVAELGRSVAKLLAERFRTLDAVLALTETDLAEVHGIGPAIARSVVKGLAESAQLIADLRVHVAVPDEAPSTTEGVEGAAQGAFAGLSFVFTGKMATLERKPAEKLVASMGGTAGEAVNKTLSYLVVGDLKKPGEQSTKEKAAAKLAAAGAPVKVISESEFLAMVERARAAAAAPPTDGAQLALF